MRKSRRWLSATLIASALAFVACAAPGSEHDRTQGAAPSSAPSPSMTSSERSDRALVVRVVDGDTIVVDLGGAASRTKVRLIGIDTPERDECMFAAATERMRALVHGKEVRMERDVSETDRYGRLLRYVYVDGTFVNATLVSEGFASAATYPPDVAHATEFVRLERVARLAKRGLWGDACPP